MRRLNQLDCRIRQQVGSCLRQHPNEWIVERMHNESWNRNLRGDPGARGAEVIIVRAGKAAVVSGDLVVEFSDRPDRSDAIHGVDLRKQLYFTAESAHQVA